MAGKRTSGNSGPDGNWLLIEEKALKQPGGTLLVLLARKANEKGITRTKLAEELGISYAYLYKLVRGDAEVTSLNPVYLANAAKFLELPRLAVKMAAGLVSYEDMFQQPDLYQMSIDPAIDFIRHDPNMAGYMPPELEGSSDAIKAFVIYLYERATGKRLMPPIPDPFQLAESLLPIKIKEGLAFLERVQSLRDELDTIGVDALQLNRLDEVIEDAEAARPADGVAMSAMG